MDLTGKHLAILGAGRSGLGAARLALKLGAGAVVFDEGDAAKLQASVQALAKEGVACVCGLEAAQRAVKETGFDLCVLSPGLDAGWPLPRLFTDAGVPLMGELEFGWRPLRHIPMVGITGTNGKTTATELIERMFRGCGSSTIACGNYGHALSEVAVSDPVQDVLTVEVSSFQLETISEFRPKVAIWLNFAADHLDRYPDIGAYFAAKKRIFENMTEADTAVVRAGDDPGPFRAQRITFTTEPGVEADFRLDAGTIFFRGEKVCAVTDLPLHERHNIENQMAALATGHAFGLAFPDLVRALSGYEPARHRCELVRVVNGRRYINDSKATNLHALESCLRSQDEPVVLIAGGKEKGLDYTPFRPLLKEKVTALVTLGEIAGALSSQFSDLVPCVTAATVPDAVREATRLAAPGQAVVFSPGTSSFDMFSGYAERGNVFRDAVMALPESQT